MAWVGMAAVQFVVLNRDRNPETRWIWPAQGNDHGHLHGDRQVRDQPHRAAGRANSAARR